MWLLTLTNTDKKAMIDDKNFERVMRFKWYYKRVGRNSYYVATSINRDGKVKTLYLHRFILQPSADKDVHHIDEDTLNNLEENLEERYPVPHRCYHLAKRRSCRKDKQLF